MNWHHKRSATLITGQSGSGKSTLFLARLTSYAAAWKLVFDAEGEAAHKLRVPAVKTVAGLVNAVAAQRLIVFDPSELFRRRLPEGFDFFCQWAWHVSEALPGVKLLACDEIKRFLPPGRPIGPGLRDVMDTGRRRGLDVLFATHTLGCVNWEVRGQLTDVVTFRQSDGLPLEWLESPEIGIPRSEVIALPVPGGYIHKNLLTGDSKTYAPDTTRKHRAHPALARKKA